LKEEASLKTEKFIQDLAVYQAKIQELEVFSEMIKKMLIVINRFSMKLKRQALSKSSRKQRRATKH